MRCLVLCHSATGNTRFGVDLIRREIEASGGTCQVRRAVETKAEEIEAHDLIGVASPVFGFQPALPVQDLLKEIPLLPGRLGFAFCSFSISPANTLSTLGELLEKKGVSVIGTHAMRGEESWPPLRLPGRILGKGRPNLQDARAVRDFARHLIRSYWEWKETPTASAAQGSHADSAGSVLPSRSPAFDRLTRFLTPEVMRLSMGRVTVAKTRCIRCGRCAAECPVGAITLSPYPMLGRACIGCWACFNLCPQGAIASNLARNRVPYPGMLEYQKMRIERALEKIV